MPVAADPGSVDSPSCGKKPYALGLGLDRETSPDSGVEVQREGQSPEREECQSERESLSVREQQRDQSVREPERLPREDVKRAAAAAGGSRIHCATGLLR